MRNKVSQGVRGLIGIGFGITPEESSYPDLAKEFLEIYQRRSHSHSVFFPGMEKLLNDYRDRDIPLGIVTNKPRYLTETLADRLDLSQWFGSIICGDDMPLKKPHPEPMLKACEELSANAERSVYLGDAKRDMEAGKNSGMLSVLVGWGYFNAEEDAVHSWPADHVTDTMEQLESLLEKWEF